MHHEPEAPGSEAGKEETASLQFGFSQEQKDDNNWCAAICPHAAAVHVTEIVG